MSTGSLLSFAVYRAVDANGAPINGAKLQFYLTGTTTPATTYTSSAMGVALSNPVVADSAGLFVPIYLDPTVTYRMQLQTSGGSVIQDIDPVFIPPTVADGSVTSAKLASGVALANLGYTPLNKAGDTATNLVLAFSAYGVASPGYIAAPINEQDANYTLVLGDNGKMIRANSGSGIAYTIPKDTYPQNAGFVFRNVGAGAVTLTPATGVTFYKAGTVASVTSISLAQSGLCTALIENTNTWVFSGTGMT